MYLNGVAGISKTGLPGILPNLTGTPLTIGRDLSDYELAGLIDEVRIYSTALTSAEIQKHYAEGLFGHLLTSDFYSR
jgi:hypothetical protein